MARRTLFALLGLALAGCGVGRNPLTAPERAELRAAEQRWAARAASEYVFEVRVMCFCPPDLNVWNRIRVTGDSVVERTPLETPPGGPSALPLQFFPTVPRLFAVVREAETGGRHLDDMQATYDPVLGYPRRVVQVCKPNLADCGTTYEARNLVVIR